MRESLILLADEGLVQVFPQVGTFVSRVDPDRVRDTSSSARAVADDGSVPVRRNVVIWE